MPAGSIVGALAPAPPDKTVTVVFASRALVPTLVLSVKVNVVVPEPVLGVKTRASSSLVIAPAVPDRV